MAELRLLLTGATGYIGGSILTGLLGTQNETLKKLKISALVRKQEQADALKEQGVEPILFRDLDDSEAIRKAASEHDGFHIGCAKALAEGLGDRKKKTGKDVYLIHTSGTSNLGDRVATGDFIETRIFSDKDDIYGYEKAREEVEPYHQRTTEMTAIDTATELGVKSYVIMSPLIYGIGSGFFNKTSMQIPWLIKWAIENKQAVVIAEGKGIWNRTHIADLVPLYLLILEKAITGADIPSNQKGIYFSENGENTFLEISEGVGKAGYALGALKTPEVKHLSVDEASNAYGMTAQLLALGLASNSRTRADLARELGWKPTKTQEDFVKDFADEFKIIYEAK